MENSADQKLTKKNIAKLTHLKQQDSLKRYQERIYTDELTGLANDKAFNDMLSGLQSSWERSQDDNLSRKGTMVVFDLTGLKIANDTYGKFYGGNDYLRSVSKSLQDGVRETDRVFRMGTSADEFILHLPNLTTDININEILDRIDKNLNNYQNEYQSKYPGIKFGLSTSFSIYDENCSPIEAYKKADTGMIGAKKSTEPGARNGSVGRSLIN